MADTNPADLRELIANLERQLAEADEVIAYMPLPPFGETPAFNITHRDEARARHKSRLSHSPEPTETAAREVKA